MKKAFKKNSDYCMVSDAAQSSSSSNYEGRLTLNCYCDFSHLRITFISFFIL